MLAQYLMWCVCLSVRSSQLGVYLSFLNFSSNGKIKGLCSRKCTIRYEMLFYLTCAVRSKADISQLNLPHGDVRVIWFLEVSPVWYSSLCAFVAIWLHWHGYSARITTAVLRSRLYTTVRRRVISGVIAPIYSSGRGARDWPGMVVVRYDSSSINACSLCSPSDSIRLPPDRRYPRASLDICLPSTFPPLTSAPRNH